MAEVHLPLEPHYPAVLEEDIIRVLSSAYYLGQSVHVVPVKQETGRFVYRVRFQDDRPR